MKLLKKLIIFLTNDFNIKIHNINIYLVFSSLTVIFLYLYSFFTGSGDIIVYRHDNLDSNIAVYKLLADTGTFFSSNDTIIPNIMNGIPRAALGSEFNIVSLLYYFFEPMYAYIINEIFIRLIAFFGMFLLLKQHFLNEEKQINTALGYALIIAGTALMFSLLPYWSNAGASIAGQPFVLYAFLNIKNRDLHFKNWFILLSFPFYSSLILAGMFVLVMLALIAVYDWFQNQTVNIYLFIVLLLMSILYLSIEYRLTINMLDPIFISHRQEFVPKYLDFHHSLSKSIKLFFKAQYHAHSIHENYILPFVLIGVISAIFSCIKNRFFDKCILLKTPFLILLSIIAISVFSGFEDFKLFQPIKEAYPILMQVQFDRVYFLFALLWFVLFAVSAKIVLDNVKWGILLMLFFVSMQVFYSFSMQNSEAWRKPTEFKRFYSEKLFSDIKNYINLPIANYRVMSIGINPSIAIYNGFYTLDGYLATYPLTYKHEFRKIIAPELEKSERWKKYYDNWGSRCRLMSEDRNITLNLEQFKKMGGQYIFSAYKVNINNGKGVKLLSGFSDKNSLSDIYLYKVN